MSLVKVIDDAVRFVRDHEQQMSRDEMDEFEQLAETVYVLAHKAGICDALPKIDEQQVEFDDLPRASYETKLNLPGDWDDAPPLDEEGLPQTSTEISEKSFLVGMCPQSRWFQDMRALRCLAEEAEKSRTGRPKKDEKPSDIKIISALCKWHEYQPGGKANSASVLNHEPAKGTDIAKMAEVSSKTVSEFFNTKFDGRNQAEGYEAACRKQQIGFHLAKWRGDLSKKDLQQLVDYKIEERRKREED